MPTPKKVVKKQTPKKVVKKPTVVAKKPAVGNNQDSHVKRYKNREAMIANNAKEALEKKKGVPRGSSPDRSAPDNGYYDLGYGRTVSGRKLNEAARYNADEEDRSAFILGGVKGAQHHNKKYDDKPTLADLLKMPSAVKKKK